MKNASLKEIKQYLESRGQQDRKLSDNTRKITVDFLNSYEYHHMIDHYCDYSAREVMEALSCTTISYCSYTDGELIDSIETVNLNDTDEFDGYSLKNIKENIISDVADKEILGK